MFLTRRQKNRLSKNIDKILLRKLDFLCILNKNGKKTPTMDNSSFLYTIIGFSQTPGLGFLPDTGKFHGAQTQNGPDCDNKSCSLWNHRTDV